MRIIIALLLVCVSCTATVPPQPQLISLMPPSTTVEKEVKVVHKPETASEFLELAFMQYHRALWKEAADTFTLAVGTGNLNDAGRALAYWHIAECYLNLRNEDEAAEAYLAFTLVAKDILDIREKRKYAVTDQGDFVQHFKLEKRMNDAVDYINDLWRSRQLVKKEEEEESP